MFNTLDLDLRLKKDPKYLMTKALRSENSRMVKALLPLIQPRDHQREAIESFPKVISSFGNLSPKMYTMLAKSSPEFLPSPSHALHLNIILNTAPDFLPENVSVENLYPLNYNALKKLVERFGPDIVDHRNGRDSFLELVLPSLTKEQFLEFPGDWSRKPILVFKLCPEMFHNLDGIPPHVVAQYGTLDQVQSLTRVDALDASKRTPIFHTLNNGDRFNLLKDKSDLLHKDILGRVPLHWAMTHGVREIIQSLTGKDVKDNSGVTPMDVAHVWRDE